MPFLVYVAYFDNNFSAMSLWTFVVRILYIYTNICVSNISIYLALRSYPYVRDLHGRKLQIS